MSVYVVLNDGDTFSGLDGCKLVTVDDEKLINNPDARDVLDSGCMAMFLEDHPDCAKVEPLNPKPLSLTNQNWRQALIGRQALIDCIEWANSRDGSAETDAQNLEEIAKIAAEALGVCPKCSNSWAQHNDDGSCVTD